MSETKINGNQIDLGEDCVGAFVELTKDVNDGKHELVSALTHKGIEASVSDSLTSLATKVNNIIPDGDLSVLKGKVWFGTSGSWSCDLIPVDRLNGCLVCVKNTNKIYLVQNGSNFSSFDSMLAAAVWEYDVSELFSFSSAASYAFAWAVSRNNQHLVLWSGTTFYRFAVSLSGLEYVASYTSQSTKSNGYPIAISNDCRYILYPNASDSNGGYSALIYDTVADATYTPTTSQWKYTQYGSNSCGYRLAILEDLSIVGFWAYYNTSYDGIYFGKINVDGEGNVTSMNSMKSVNLQSSLGQMRTAYTLVSPDNTKVFFITLGYSTYTDSRLPIVYHYVYDVSTYDLALGASSATRAVGTTYEFGGAGNSYGCHTLPGVIKSYDAENEVITFDAMNTYPHDVVVDLKNKTMNISHVNGDTVAYGYVTTPTNTGSSSGTGAAYYFGANLPVLYSSTGFTVFKGCNQTYTDMIGKGDFTLFSPSIAYLKRSPVNKRFGWQTFNTSLNYYTQVLYMKTTDAMNNSGVYDID